MIASEELLKDIIYFHVHLFQPLFSDCHSKISVCIKASLKHNHGLRNETKRMPDNFKWNKYSDGKVLKRTKSKKILGIIVDDKLSFQEHVASKTKSAFSALKGVDRFVQGQKGCSQSVYMRLY